MIPIMSKLGNIFNNKQVKLQRDAERGVISAQAKFGALCFEGRDVHNVVEATKWFHLAAEQGNHVAMWYLSLMYLTGTGVPQDFVQAYMWRTLAVAGEGEKPLRRNCTHREKLKYQRSICQILMMWSCWLDSFNQT